MFPAEIGDIGFPPRALEQYTAALEATVDIEAIRAARFKVVVDYAYGSTSFVMPNVLAKLGADILGVNPYASTAGALELRPRRSTPSRWRPTSEPPAPTSAPCSTPTASTSRSIDDTGHVLTDEQALLALLTLVSGHLLGDTVALPVDGHPPRRGHRGRATACGSAAPSWPPRPSWTPRRSPGSASPPAPTAASSSRASCPAFDAAASLVKVLELLARTGTRLSTIVEALPRPHMAHETVVTPVGAEGHRDAHPGGDEQGPRGRS